MIDLVNARFVPVWVNIRKSRVPDVRAIDPAITGIKLDEDRKVSGGFSQGFFVRTLVLSANGRFLLNPQANDDPLGTHAAKGHFPYGQVKARDYLPMLNQALGRAEGIRWGN